MLRFIITALFVTLFLICSIPLFFIEWIIGKFNMDIKNRSSLAIVNWAFRVVLFISGVKITVIGEEKCSQRSGRTLYREPQKLLRHYCDLRARTASYRIYRKKGTSESSSFKYLDEISALPLP